MGVNKRWQGAYHLRAFLYIRQKNTEFISFPNPTYPPQAGRDCRPRTIRATTGLPVGRGEGAEVLA